MRPVILRVCASMLIWALASSAWAQDKWLGGEFMPKAGAKLYRDNKVVPLEIGIPMDVEKVDRDWLWVGKGRIRKSDVVPLAEAEVYYTKYLSTNPNSGWAYYHRGVARAWQSRSQGALSDFSKAIELEPNNVQYYLRRAELHKTRYYAIDKDDANHRRQELTAATKDYTEAIRIEPDSASHLHARALAWSTMGDHDKAIADSSRAIQLDPNEGVLYARRGDSYFAKGDFPQAIADYDDAIRLEDSPFMLGGYYEDRGDIWFELGKHQRAVVDYSKAIEIAEKDNNTNYGAHIRRAQAWRAMGEFDFATMGLLKLKQAHGDGHEIRYELGLTWLAKGDHDQAITELTEAIEKTAKYPTPEYFDARAKAWKAKGEAAKAQADRDEAAKLRGEITDPWVGLPIMPKLLGHNQSVKVHYGNREWQMEELALPLIVAGVDGDKYVVHQAFDEAWGVKETGRVQKNEVLPVEDALQSYTEYLDSKSSSDEEAARAQVMRGIILAVRNEPDKARQDFDEAIRRIPTSGAAATAHMYRGVVWMTGKEFDKAIDDLNEAIRLNSEATYAYGFLVAAIQQKSGGDEMAALDEAMRMHPESAFLYLIRSGQWLAKEELDKAIADLDEAIMLDASNAQYFDVRAALWELKDETSKAWADRTNAKLLREKQNLGTDDDEPTPPAPMPAE